MESILQVSNFKDAMREFLKMPQEFQDDVVGNIDWIPPEMDNILEDKRRDRRSSR